MILIEFFLFIAVDDIEAGKGADEELCLLPDEEREISDADRERALQNQQQEDEPDEHEHEGNEVNEAGELIEVIETIEENGTKCISTCQSHTFFMSIFIFRRKRYSC